MAEAKVKPRFKMYSLQEDTIGQIIGRLKLCTNGMNKLKITDWKNIYNNFNSCIFHIIQKSS